MRNVAPVLARLTGVVLLAVGVIFTILTLSTTGTHPSGIRFLATDLPWVGPLSLVAGALAVPGVAIGRRRRALGGALLALSLGCILLLNAISLQYLYGIFLVLIFGPPIIPIALALLVTAIPQRPPTL